jgi:hypothetical protein
VLWYADEMKVLRPAAINQVRGFITWGVRGVALVLVVVGIYYLLKRTVFGAASGDMRGALTAYMGVGEGHEVAIGIACVAVGAALALLSRHLARWVIVMPPSGCPQCGHAGITAEMDRCTECGLQGFAVKAEG